MQIHALVEGQAGYFLARVVFSSTVAKDATGALQTHNRNVQVALKKSGIRNKALKLNGWRWFWALFEAQGTKMRGQGDAKSKVTPVGLVGTGSYIGSDLRSQYFDLEEIKTFEDSWKQAPQEQESAPEPHAFDDAPYYDGAPPMDDDAYDNDIPF